MSGEFAVVLVAALLVAALIAAVVVVRTRRVVATPAERAVHATLHTAATAARALRRGLDVESAGAAVPHLRDLTGAAGVALYDADATPLAHDGSTWTAAMLADAHRAAQDAATRGRRVLTGNAPALIAQPLLPDDSEVLGVLVVVSATRPGPGLLGAVGEVARYATGQLELAELGASRARLDRAEVLALRAQISSV